MKNDELRNIYLEGSIKISNISQYYSIELGGKLIRDMNEELLNKELLIRREIANILEINLDDVKISLIYKSEHEMVKDKFEKLICPVESCEECIYEEECVNLSQRLKELSNNVGFSNWSRNNNLYKSCEVK